MSTISRGRTGHRYGRWTVLSEAPTRFFGKKNRRYCFCVCDCGTKREVNRDKLVSGEALSCGCIHKENISRRQTTHGKSFTAEFMAWSNLKGRCLNPSDKDHHKYGGRGITVCERWLHSFENFLEDMGERPSSKHSIERKNNNLGYSPENCIWGTRTEQSRNKRDNVNATFDGKTQCLEAWAQEYGLKTDTLRFRVKSGWSFEDALKRPVRSTGR